ncbi:MAG: hypothetical protein V3R91_04965 [Myxococcota bacterium]
MAKLVTKSMCKRRGSGARSEPKANGERVAHDRSCAGPRMTRRQILVGGIVGVGVLALSPRSGAQTYALPEETQSALARSGLVYISPLRSDGEESRCHGEVWFAHDHGSVLIVTQSDGWKSRALSAGLDRARIWVGDFGPVHRAGDRYRSAPGFLAKATSDKDDAVFERLLAAYAKKYPDEWDRWESRFRRGYADASRVLIRYEPIGA